MKIYNLSNMKDGWFLGDFDPSVFKTDLFEVCYKKHEKGEKWDTHYHEKCTEINLLVKGRMLINETHIEAGQIFVIEPYFVSNPTFLEDCELVIIKTPSVIGDKIIINKDK